ncbi:hypothetical protein B0H34DRAFT_679637 [Crassisporium funariophilum]|nr:hypothetical protein B0H34DRAFT_679637 [Crassisporium funariophilum]
MAKFKFGFAKSSSVAEKISSSSFDEIRHESPCSTSSPNKSSRFFSFGRSGGKTPDRNHGVNQDSPKSKSKNANTVIVTTSASPNKQMAAFLFHRHRQGQTPSTRDDISLGYTKLVKDDTACHDEGDASGTFQKLLEQLESSAARKKTLSSTLSSFELVNDETLDPDGNMEASTVAVVDSSESFSFDPTPDPPLKALWIPHRRDTLSRNLTSNVDEKARTKVAADIPHKSNFRRMVEHLQHAARRVQEDEMVSQESIFRSTAPLAVFFYLLAVGVLVPRWFSASASVGEKVPSVHPRSMVMAFFGGMLLMLAVLRGVIWVLGVLGQTFCDLDLVEVFRTGECVDVDGKGMGGAELIVGNLFL